MNRITTARKQKQVNGSNRISQKRKLINLLYNHGCSTAPSLSKKLKISLPTCINLLNDLLQSGYIQNFGTGESNGGRKPNLYGLPKDCFYILVCDIARYEASLTICNIYNSFIVPPVKIKTDIDDPELVDKLYQAAHTLMAENQIPDKKLIGVGVDMPGLIDSVSGINYTIKDENYRHVSKAIENRFHKPVFIDNDARMHGYGEVKFGVAKGKKNAVIIHWSWGLGLAIYLNGQLYSGHNGFAGEFSHIPMVDNGEVCICGKRGCLETVASSNAIMKLVGEGIKKGSVSTMLAEFRHNPEAITPETVIEWARKGDEFCISILYEIGRAMGKGLSYLIQVLNPEIIVLSGPVSKARQYILSPIQQSINLLCLEKISKNTSVVVSSMGDQTALLGLAATLFNTLLNELEFKSAMQVQVLINESLIN